MTSSLLFGTAGIPLSTEKPSTLNGIKRVKELGLNAMELEFVRSINVSKELAPKVKKTAKENQVKLTVHAPYYLNLNSLKKKTIETSKRFILDSARIGFLCGAENITFHAAYYMKQEPKKVFEKVKKELKEILRVLREESINVWVRPETTGKNSQFGALEETVQLSEELEWVLPCIDFSHIHARTQKMNSFKEFKSELELIESRLGKTALKNLHCHVSGIAYSEKGERHHLNLKESDFKYKELLKALEEFKAKGIIISESPNIEEDALLMQKEWKKLK
jgi:deoxyribonuclease-4